MKISRISFALLMIILILTISLNAKSQKAMRPVIESNFKAINILDTSIYRMTGGKLVAAFKSLSVYLNGKKFMEGQSRTFSGPLDSLPVSQFFFLDFEKDWILNETIDRYLGGYVFSFRTVFADSLAFNYEVPKVRFSQLNHLSSNAKSAYKLQLLRNLPLYLLKAARENPTSLRFVGEVRLKKKPCYHVTGSIPGAGVMDIFIDKKSMMLLCTGQMSQNLIRGDQTTYTYYLNYQKISETFFPKKRIICTDFIKLREDTITVAINPPEPKEDAFAIPVGYRNPAVTKKEFKVLGKGIFMLENIDGYNVLCLEYSDHIMILEAVQGSPEVIALTKKKFPGKDIRYVAISHHHEDHASGLREFIAKDIKVVAGDKTADFVRYISNGNRLLFPDHQQIAKNIPDIISVAKQRKFNGDGPEMLMLDFGPNSHADQIFAYYFPQEHILFQADLLISSDEGKVVLPIIPINLEFYNKLKALNLRLDKIYGVHLKEVSFSDFEKAILASLGQ